MKVHLVIVDPQNDFCVADNGAGNKGTLVVPNGDQDMSRVAAMLGRLGGKIDDIHVTMDSHRPVDISHPRWWKRVGDGAAPAPFTILGVHNNKAVKFAVGASGLTPTDEEYTTYLPSFLLKGGPTGKGSKGYLESLQSKGHYPHVIWPEHCIIGSWGHNVVPSLHTALCDWERSQFAQVDYVTKGSNPWTEHFSGVQAEVPDPQDPGTQVNTRLIQTLQEADIIAVAGEALSHCVASTVTDIVRTFADPQYAQKIVLLTDCMSNVPGFEGQGEAFLKDMQSKGVKMTTSIDFLA